MNGFLFTKFDFPLQYVATVDGSLTDSLITIVMYSLHVNTTNPLIAKLLNDYFIITSVVDKILLMENNQILTLSSYHIATYVLVILILCMNVCALALQ